MNISDELIDLGLTKTCDKVEFIQAGPQILRDYCGTPVLSYGGKCSKHSTDLEMARQATAEVKKNAAIHRARLEDEVLPLATERVLRILTDPETKDADIIKIWQATMDRVGLAAVSGIIVEGNVTVDAPLDILRRMLTAPAEAIEIVDAEVVAELEA